ncbi:hypothetical protein EDF78_11919 [Rahnella sp. BIGb0236]|nr:hypothetical protein EDF78_11919 [Rahnella sp. BIGb0236]
MGLTLPLKHTTQRIQGDIFSLQNKTHPAPFDIIEDYQEMTRHHDTLAMCIESGIIAQKYHAAKSLDEEMQWRFLQRINCRS